MNSKLKFTSFRGNRKTQKLPIYIPNHCISIVQKKDPEPEPEPEPEPIVEPIIEPEPEPIIEPVIIAPEPEPEPIILTDPDEEELNMLNGIMDDSELSQETKEKITNFVNFDNRFKMVRQKNTFRFIK